MCRKVKYVYSFGKAQSEVLTKQSSKKPNNKPNKKLMKVMSRSVAPTLATLQLLVFYKFYYSEQKTWSSNCRFDFFVCVVLDSLILWS